MTRYNGDGTLDLTFDADGRLATNFTSGYDALGDLALDADGKIVAAGVSGGRDWRFALARYNSDGSLDTTFGGDGRVTTNFTAGPDFAHGVAIQESDGKIIAAGRAGGSGGRIALARYNPDGTLDTTFGGDGKVATNFTAGDDRADIVALQGDERIIIAGTANYTRVSARFALARYNADGSLDTTFHRDGRVTTDFTSAFDGAFGAAMQTDGKIVAAGQAGGTLGVARYLADGTLDSDFSGDGKATTNFTSGVDYADEVRLQPDGKIVAAGTANYFARESNLALTRYNPDGSPDTTFSADGKVTTNQTWGRDGAFSVAIQPADGKIVTAGYATGYGSMSFALGRYLGS